VGKAIEDEVCWLGKRSRTKDDHEYENKERGNHLLVLVVVVALGLLVGEAIEDEGRQRGRKMKDAGITCSWSWSSSVCRWGKQSRTKHDDEYENEGRGNHLLVVVVVLGLMVGKTIEDEGTKDDHEGDYGNEPDPTGSSPGFLLQIVT
jgi:hypothetical protein